MRLIDFDQIEDGGAFLAKITEAAKIANEAIEAASKIEKSVETTVVEKVLPAKDIPYPTGKEDPGLYYTEIHENGYPMPTGNVITLGGNEGSQIAIGHDGDGNLVIYIRGRKKDSDKWGDWLKLATVPYVDSKDKELKDYVDKLLNGLKKLTDAQLEEIEKYVNTKVTLLEAKITRDSMEREDLIEKESKRTDELLDKQYIKITSYVDKKNGEANDYTDTRIGDANDYTDEQIKKITRYIDQTGTDLGKHADSNLQDAKDYANKKESDANRYTDNRIAALVNSAPEALDTLRELSNAIGNDPNFATTIMTVIGTKLDKSGGVITGDLAINKNLTVNGTIKGTFQGNITGNVSGNADSATKLKNTRSFCVKDATRSHSGKSVDFDGTSNVILELPSKIDADIFGNADTATKATQDKNGHDITATYFPYAGGTITGDVAIKKKLEVDGRIKGCSFIGGLTVCDTDSGVAKKAAPLPGFALEKNAWIAVKFSKDNSADNPTLSINGTAAKSICTGGIAIKKRALRAGKTYIFVYDGVNYEMCGSASSGGGSAYGVCNSGAGAAAKVVTCDDFDLETGAHITVRFANGNTAANATLNVNSTGARPIYYQGVAIPANALMAKTTYNLVYNGTQFEVIGPIFWIA